MAVVFDSEAREEGVARYLSLEVGVQVFAHHSFEALELRRGHRLGHRRNRRKEVHLLRGKLGLEFGERRERWLRSLRVVCQRVDVIRVVSAVASVAVRLEDGLHL